MLYYLCNAGVHYTSLQPKFTVSDNNAIYLDALLRSP